MVFGRWSFMPWSDTLNTAKHGHTLPELILCITCCWHVANRKTLVIIAPWIGHWQAIIYAISETLPTVMHDHTVTELILCITWLICTKVVCTTCNAYCCLSLGVFMYSNTKLVGATVLGNDLPGWIDIGIWTGVIACWILCLWKTDISFCITAISAGHASLHCCFMHVFQPD